MGLVLVDYMSADQAHRVIMGAFAILLPLAFGYLARSMAPGARWTPLFGFLLIYTDSYFVGFTNLPDRNAALAFWGGACGSYRRTD